MRQFDMTVRHVHVNRHRLAYIRRGQGVPLLLIQGMGGHHQMWGEWFLGPLERYYDTVAYDHRGIGASDPATAPFGIADLVDDAAGVIAALGWSSAHVFGISLGGMIAQELALRHPEVVRTLTIGCSWAGGPDGVMSETSQRIVDAIATRDVEHALRTGYEANLSPQFAADPSHYDLYANLALAERVPVPVVLMQWDAAQRHDTASRLPDITAPTLVLHGTADAALPVTNGRHLASLIPHARLELFNGVGHLFWWEQPQHVHYLLQEHQGIRHAH